MSELAPPPSTEDLFGNINELKEAHKRQLAEYERAQEINKARMEEGLKERLRARKSKRRKVRLQKEQENALNVAPPGKVEHPVVQEETITSTEEAGTGGDGNPDVIARVNDVD